jgi:hypothetical protein
MWRNLSMLGINKDGQPGAAVLHKIEAGQRAQPAQSLDPGAFTGCKIL